MVRRAGSAQAAARGQDGCVREEDPDGVVVAGYGLRSDFGEGGGDGVPYFRLELAAVVGEGDPVFLAAGDEDCSGWEYDRVREDSGKRHRADCLHGGCAHRRTDGDDVGICRRIGALLYRCEQEFLAYLRQRGRYT